MSMHVTTAFGFVSCRTASRHNPLLTHLTHLLHNVYAVALHAHVASVGTLLFPVHLVSTQYHDASILQNVIHCIQHCYAAVPHLRMHFGSYLANSYLYTVSITYTSRMSSHHFHTTVEYISHHYLFCSIFPINVRQAPCSHSPYNTNIILHMATFQLFYLFFGSFTINTLHPAAQLL